MQDLRIDAIPPSPPPSAPAMTSASRHDGPQTYLFSFTGSGSEYFRIWIVNLLLTIVTLGIYSAWAKVRRQQYFYSNIRVGDASFDYHGKPTAILKGRLAALALIAAYQLSARSVPSLGIVLLLVIGAAMPWMIWKSLQFRLYNSSYRGIRFGMQGTLGQVYWVYLVLPVVSLFTFYLAAPLAHQRIKRFQHSESRFGTTRFSFNAEAGQFYRIYLLAGLLSIGGVVVLSVLFGGNVFRAIARAGEWGTSMPMVSLAVFVAGLYLWMFMAFAIFNTMLHNLVWSHTDLGLHRFSSAMTWKGAAFIAMTNVLGVVFTCGLFLPFAQVRTMRYRIESLSLLAEGSLDDFVADNQTSASAVGEGMSDLLDFDISL